MPELSGRQLLDEWRRMMDSVVKSAASVAERSEVTRLLLEPMQRQLELVQEIVEREQRLQKELTGLLLSPFEAVFDLLGQSAETMRRQAEALEGAGQAIEETATLMKAQAELFEKAIGALRQPLEVARGAASLDARPRRKP